MPCDGHTADNTLFCHEYSPKKPFITNHSLTTIVFFIILFFLVGCSGPQSILDPAGPSAKAIANLWWGMFTFSAIVLFTVVILWLYALWRKPPRITEKQARLLHNRWIINGGLVLPMASITIILSFGIPMTGYHMLPLDIVEQAPLRIEVTGHQWWWEVRYPSTGFVTKNELHLPVGVPIDVHVNSADVIHSFWVPKLAGKIDAIPGRTNILRLQSDTTGHFRGQCAEFCGTKHALMVLSVKAHTPENFKAWLKAQRND